MIEITHKTFSKRLHNALTENLTKLQRKHITTYIDPPTYMKSIKNIISALVRKRITKNVELKLFAKANGQNLHLKNL